METLKRLDEDKLLDIVKNYHRYGYDKEIQSAAISILIEKGWCMEDLKDFGHLKNHNYNDALRAYNAYRRNVKAAYIIFFLSLGILSIVSLVFIFLAYRNQIRFYRSLGRYDESVFHNDIWGVFLYFHFRDTMKEQLKGIS